MAEDRSSGVRLLVEAVAVFASILLAFAIDAAWDRSQERDRERDLVAAVVQEMTDNREAIRRSLEVRDQADARVEWFLKSTDDELSSDSVGALFIGMAAFAGLYQPQVGATRALLAAGRMSTTEGRVLQAMAGQWEATASNVSAQSEEIRKRSTDLQEHLATHIAATGRHDFTGGTLPGAVALGPDFVLGLRGDDRLRALLLLRLSLHGQYALRLSVLDELAGKIVDVGSVPE